MKPRSSGTTGRRATLFTIVLTVGVMAGIIVGVVVAVDLLAGTGLPFGPQPAPGIKLAARNAAGDPGASRQPVPSVTTKPAVSTSGPQPIASTARASAARTAKPPAHPSPSTSALVEQSSGHTIRLRLGQTISVDLPGGGAGGYTPPAASSTVLLRVFATGGYPSGQRADARFTATRPGSAELTSMTDFICLHTRPACLPPQRLWIVHVIVTP